MAIEAGQWWKTRDGERVRIVGKTAKGDCWIFETAIAQYRVGLDGRVSHRHESNLDLIEHLPWCKSFECEEPPKPKNSVVWVKFCDGTCCDILPEPKGEGDWRPFREVRNYEELFKIAEEIFNEGAKMNVRSVTLGAINAILQRNFGVDDAT